LHRLIGAGIFNDTAGKYRTNLASAIGSTVAYALPSKIPSRVATLFQFVNETRSSLPADSPSLARLLQLGAFFMSEFLLIHPFSNGNGRTARLLLNYFLRDVTVVPFSLYYQDRKVYIDTLECRNAGGFPQEFATYTLLCAEKTACDLYHLLLN